jgi:hypothetical protein
MNQHVSNSDRNSYAARRWRWACDRCGEKPIPEEMALYFETGLCGWCEQMTAKDD